MNRYQIRYGKFGAYFYDTETEMDLPLISVLEILNTYDAIKKVHEI